MSDCLTSNYDEQGKFEDNQSFRLFLLFLLCCFRRIFNHDNVGRLQGVGIKGPRSFMVHEYLSNGNMQNMITLYACILSS